LIQFCCSSTRWKHSVILFFTYFLIVVHIRQRVSLAHSAVIIFLSSSTVVCKYIIASLGLTKFQSCCKEPNSNHICMHWSVILNKTERFGYHRACRFSLHVWLYWYSVHTSLRVLPAICTIGICFSVSYD
jgi:hypothetical protein